MTSTIVRAECLRHAVTYLTPWAGAGIRLRRAEQELARSTESSEGRVEPGEELTCGVELVTTTISIEQSGDLTETRRVSWYPGSAGRWSLSHADALVADLGLVRTGRWHRLGTGDANPVAYGCALVESSDDPPAPADPPRLTLIDGHLA